MPEVKSFNDVYPFGMTIKDRSWFDADGAYRYGFNGKEKDLALNNEGNTLDFGARIYDARVAKFLSVDPWEDKYAWQSPYAYFRNSPISVVDFKGLGGKDKRVKIDKKSKTVSLDLEYKFVRDKDMTDEGFAEAKAEYLKTVKASFGSTAKHKGEDYKLNTNVSEGGGKNAITVYFDETLDRSRATKNGSEQWIKPSGISNNDGFHETLHNLGLSDRYHYTQSTTKTGRNVTSVSDAYNSIPMSLTPKQDPEHIGRENLNAMAGSGTYLTSKQWKHIVGRKAEKNYKQYTFIYKAGGTVSGRAITGIRDNGSYKIGFWTRSSGILQVTKGFDLHYNAENKSGNVRLAKSLLLGKENNEKKLLKPYEEH